MNPPPEPTPPAATAVAPVRRTRKTALKEGVLEIRPSTRFEGEIEPPGDKSISHRAVILAALADGTTHLTNFLPGEDCLCTLRAMQALGCPIEQVDATTLIVHGLGCKLQPALEPINCGNSGTALRLLAGMLAGQSFRSRLYGDRSLSKRPMKRIIDPLTRMGASITAQGRGDTPPLEIVGANLEGIEFTSPVSSAQLKSCVLLAGLFGQGTTSVKEPARTRDHTERLLEHFHVPVVRDGNTVQIQGGSRPHANDLCIPGDFSSAAFWLVAAASAPDTNLVVKNVGLNPTRTGLLSILLRMGAQVNELIETQAAEPHGILRVTGRKLKGTRIGGDEIPNVIDELPILAVAGALAHGETVIADAAELRVKESDRIKTMAENLRAFGVPVSETRDGMVIQGGAPLKGARVSSHGDHRVAMACAILALFAKESSQIEDVDCIATSYPGFVQDLQRLTDQSSVSIANIAGSMRRLTKS